MPLLSKLSFSSDDLLISLNPECASFHFAAKECSEDEAQHPNCQLYGAETLSLFPYA